ncbi:SanA/YdcF family protein [Nonlabens xiamenensis]|uniref:SanA/YdcF family protein n=1 Tax=Nonlabens xiamenensis TaxID=2341043 RepID=UPI000F60DAAA|nr:ElyC/SanA/YdcF family protein [Nonlabens xiamenensis]
MRRFLNILVFVVVAIVVGILVLQLHVKKVSRPHIYTNIKEVPAAHTGIVLGASVRPDKSLSLILQDRVDAALLAYKENKIKKFLLSGDHGDKHYDEVNAMKDYLNEKGVPNEDIFLDHAGFDTYDSMFRARDVFEVEEAIVFTQEFHLPRAIYLGQKLGLNIDGYVVDQHNYEGNSHFKRREWLANIKAWMELNIEKQPTFTGTVIPITGDSSPSHDP